MNSTAYPSFARRYFGLLIDVLATLFLAGVIVNSGLAPDNRDTNTIIIALLFATYEPFLTAYGATLGQLLMRFRIRMQSDLQRIPLWRAYLRFIVKTLLGVVSLVTVATRRDRKAIHDIVAGTIAVESGTMPSEKAAGIIATS